MRTCGKAFGIYRGDKLDRPRTKCCLDLVLRPSTLVSQAIHTSFAQQRLVKLAFGRFVRQCESDMFLRKSSERQTPETCSNLLELKKFGELSGKMPSGALD